MIYGKQLNIKITDFCNAECSFCGYNRTAFKELLKEGYQPSVLDVEKMIKNFDHLKRKGFRKLHITGGEPFVHPMLIEFIRAAKKHGFAVQTGTNGSLLTEERIRQLKEVDIDYLWLSLDTFPLDKHLEHRGLVAFKEKFHEGIRLLQEYKINFFGQTVISHVIPKRNGLPDLEGHVKYYFEQFGIRRFIFSYPMYRPEKELENKHLATSGSDAVCFDKKTLTDIYNKIILLKRRLKAIQIINPYISLWQQLEEINGNGGHFGCYAGQDIFFLGKDQTSLRPCYFYGDVIVDEINSPALKENRTYEFCKDCSDECFRDASLIYYTRHHPGKFIRNILNNSELRRYILKDLWNVTKTGKYRNV